ncbi:Neurogenic locus Notch protein-like [Oopsacas minuta]|uniref:Neurogenic locus Notch protein-like n=1 Tax=Oopsacas minuta TaxID=111878 RepID=A0AAV7KFQ4_9METZ|nr:Neurogenic locus Notch protein-like [Oopsacas minuta]
MHLYLLEVFIFLSTIYGTHGQSLFCINECDCCNNVRSSCIITIFGVTDCCDSTLAKGNIDLSTGECTLCPDCENEAVCEIDPITANYSAFITRPTAGNFLFTISVTVTCPQASNLDLFYARGTTSDDLFITVHPGTGIVSVVIASPPNEVRTYSGSIKVQLIQNGVDVLSTVNVPYNFTVYDAIQSNATEYTATTTNSRVGGLYLFTAGTITPNFTVVYSIKPLIGDPDSISIDNTTGRAITSTIQPPIVIRDYLGVVEMAYTSDLDPSLTGVIEVQFSFTIALPLTPDPSLYPVILTFPPTTPLNIMAFTITYSFFPGFTINSFIYDLFEEGNRLNIDHSTNSFTFPINSNTEVKRYPENRNEELSISYFSKEMYEDGPNNFENVYKGTLNAYYSIFLIDPCGFSPNDNNTCQNGGVCSISGFTFNCSCTEFFEGSKCGFDVNECTDPTYCNTGVCNNTFGGFSCSCPVGYTGVRCFTDVNECDFVPAICLNQGVCTNTIGSYLCNCTATGYEGDNCQNNVNECTENVDLCSPGVCTDADGSFLCNCTETGHRGMLCKEEIDECNEQPGLCQNNGVCTNTIGSYLCNCSYTGFEGINCENNIDECTVDAILCQPGVCIDSEGSFGCNCTETGFIGELCTVDINECSFDPSVCMNNGVCSNTNGSFLCNCANTGYTGLICSQDINECLILPSLCKNNGSCINSPGLYDCNCTNTGYEGDNCEININECEITPTICGTGQCIDKEGTYLCNCTSTGFVGSNCDIDVNECNQVPPICQNNGTCSNIAPYYSCSCNNTGYTGENCEIDIDECLMPNQCNNGVCNNTLGSFTCECNAGYTGLLCDIDIIECDIPDICNNGTCNNTQGSFSCSCFVGYKSQLCDEDVNECNTIFGLCSSGDCNNLFGSYFCDCTGTGYRGENCTVNIDECFEDTNICNNGNCTDTPGSYNCNCFPGYTGDNCSINIDECTDIPDLCNNSTCIDTPGSYTCVCRAGITGNNCVDDINECLDTTLCTPGTCRNILGSYTCNCSNTGFKGRNCTDDINECLNTIICNAGSCIDESGSFTCNCTNTGFTGSLCETDIDECNTLFPCLNSGICNNIPGSYECVCPSGFTGNNCGEDVNECLTVPNICNLGTCINNIGNFSCACPAGVTGSTCNVSMNGTVVCPAGMGCTSDKDCMSCLCHRNFTYLKPVYVLLSEPLVFDGDMLLPFEREIQPEIVGDVTIVAKLRQTKYDEGYVMFIGSSTVYRNLGLFLDYNSSTAYLFYTRAGASSYTKIQVTSFDVRGPSVHTIAVVLNFTNSEAIFFKNGVMVDTQPLTGTPDYILGERKNSRVMFVGGRIENLFKFTGWMEYVFLYPFGLTQSQITKLHDEGPIVYDGTGRCRGDVTSDICISRPHYKPSVPTQHHSFATKTRCDSSRYPSRGLSGVYTCSPISNTQECSINSNCPSGHACGEYLPRDGHSLLPAVFDPYFHAFRYALLEEETEFFGFDPITISITKRPILTLDLTIFVTFRQLFDNEGYIVAKGVSAHARDFGLYLRGTSNTVWFVYKSKTGFHDYAIFSNITVDDELDHTMAVVLLQADNSRFVYLYVDGLPRGCVKINNRVVFTPEINRLTIGGRPGTDEFNFEGIIYKLHIFDVALSFSAISDLHNVFSNNLLVRYCTPLQTTGDSCYIERRTPFFKCESDLGCVPTRFFNRTIPVLPQQDKCYGVPYTLGQCLSCDCPTPAANQLVCGINGVTYADDCFLNCAGATLFTEGPCITYQARFDLFAGGNE